MPVDDAIDDRPAVEMPALLYPVVLLEALPSLADVLAVAVPDVLVPDVPVAAAEVREAARARPRREVLNQRI